MVDSEISFPAHLHGTKNEICISSLEFSFYQEYEEKASAETLYRKIQVNECYLKRAG